ncbi:DNA-formamidopyrimidine glycosylase [Spiroplasma culicicola]|uniref:Formamidopyrimidine-DNA glycosylase n=1 Tax=Spiroplasma culicicola AES-1 TaxID=1276246 RepID=W6A8K5_9MOLU|nr:DNA-formamidopyrimidine glycosylase [Spiroplasma culicicola]AHI53215.1 formamidopyrimidine-DNA glycosylase [Spiroplasma culicicola AES-1]
MPELPEVETVVNSLRKRVVGYTILEVKMYYLKLFKGEGTIEEFKKSIKNRKIEHISRIAKHIIFELGDMVLISHLRMEGKWFVYDSKDIYDKKHILAEFILSDNKILAYHDTRRFGTFHYQKAKDYKEQLPISKVGPEPFNPIVTAQYLYDKMAKSSKHIKTVLLDQTKISGIGNIYADEILYDAKIHPLTLAKDLNINDYQRILDSSIKILNWAISLGGSTIDTYQPEQGIDGKFQNELQVHTRKNQKCYACNNVIIKIKVNGRGTYLCFKCQERN